MEIITHSISSLILEVVKSPFGPVKRHLCYFFNHERKLKFLNDQLQKLKEEKERMQHRADAATRDGRQIEQDVQNWLTNVHKTTTKAAEELQKYEDETKKRCFVGFCPDFMSRYRLSKKAEEEAILLVQLLTEANQFSTKEISFCPDPQLMVSTSAQRGFETFQSREVILQDILTALKDPSIQRIGVFGMGGVGKTMLMREIACITKRDNLFDDVAVATISNSQKTNIGSIQEEIADALGLRFAEGSVSGRSNRLRQRLNEGKKILVILDDIWEKIDLEAAGIIFHQNQNMSKLLLNSRSSDTLCIHMNVDTTFELTSLSSKESMVLFTKIVGSKAEEPDYKRVAIDVVAKCAGLPVAISAVANALKEKKIDIWKNALQQLKRANPKSIEGVEKRVYSALKLSYEHLQNKPAQSLFLLCSLQPQGLDILISDLINYSWGMGLLEDVCSVEEARGNTTALVQKLQASSLLLSSNYKTVRMHDIVRDVSISIAGENNQMFVIEEQVRLEKLLKDRIFENCTALSLPYSNIGELPHELKCPQLQFFSCFSKDGSLEVPDAFFRETKKLKVLHLAGMNFSCLPSSFLSLTNLQTLCLHDCKLQDLARIGELKNLEVLSFFRSDVMELPLKLKNLSMLKLLSLNGCIKVKVIPANLISSLCHLEELYMGGSFYQWDIEGNASLSELKYLKKLTALEIHIWDVGKIPNDLFSQNLERYKIHIGYGYSWCDKPERSRLLNVELNTNMYLDHGIEMLLKKTEDLRFIMPMKGVMKIISMLDGAGSHLKDLHIRISANKREITETSLLMVSFFNHKVMLCYLENLELFRINNPSIWNNEPSTWPISLTRLTVGGCNNLKHLFSTSMAGCLKQLKHLTIKDCHSMIDIIATEVEEIADVILFPNLSSLYLEELPNLMRFSRNLIEFYSLNTLHISSCHVLKSFVSNDATAETMVREKARRNDLDKDESFNIPSLFNERVFLPKLKRLIIENLNSLRKIWQDQLSLGSFNNINYFSMRGCHGLLKVFPIQMLARLQRLDKLIIVDCNSVEEIFDCNLGAKSTVIKFELTTLTQLELRWIPKLRSLSCKAIECPSLRTIEVLACNQVQLLFCWEEYISFGRPQQKESQQPLFWVNKIGFPSLEELSLKYNDNLEQIWEGQLPSQCSPKLKCMVLSSKNKLFCEGLKGVLPMVQLSQLSLYGIDELIRWPWDEKSDHFRQVFNKLTTLQVSYCGELKKLLVPSSISFSNLVTMTISKCHRLISLLTHSTAKSLVHLTTMIICYCSEIKEIIAKDGAKDGIIFTQLKSVQLDGLSELEGFCLGNCNIQFPSLNELTVNECPKMRIFCLGEVVTPKLQSICLGRGLGQGQSCSVKNRDTNNSIQQIYDRDGRIRYSVS